MSLQIFFIQIYRVIVFALKEKMVTDRVIVFAFFGLLSIGQAAEVRKCRENLKFKKILMVENHGDLSEKVGIESLKYIKRS